jgi:two-component system phosphate regulon response regulator PhoB
MKPTVLLVEDDRPLRDLMELRLTRLGFHVSVAGDGVEALKMIREHPPQVILLDILLPQMNGLELMRLLRDEPNAPAIPIIVISALGFREVVQQAIAAGAQDFMLKPFDMHALTEKLSKYLPAAETG